MGGFPQSALRHRGLAILVVAEKAGTHSLIGIALRRRDRN
jgi:hypothetical protein